jgi:biotin operon repressor
MSSLESALAHWSTGTLDVVVHVGAGRGDELEGYAALAVRRAVLVEGDSQAATALRDAVAGRPWAEVLERVVAAEGGDADWNRYNLPALNGLADALDTRHIFPRLRRESAQRVATTTLDALIATIGLPAKSRAVLVLDMHGIDARLLDLPHASLHRFEGIVVRGTVRAQAQGDASIDSRLLAAGFEPELSGDDDALWPVQRWTFDRLAFENSSLRRRADDADGALRDSRDELAAVRARLATELEATRRAADEARADFDRERAGLAERIEQLGADASQSRQRGRQLETQLQLLGDEHARASQQAESRLAEALQSKAQLERERADLAAAVSAHGARIDALAVQLSQAGLKADAQAGEIDELRVQAVDQAQREQEAQALFERERAGLATAAATHVARIDVLVGKLTAADVKVAAQSAEIEALRQQGVALARQQKESHAQFDLERAELASAADTQAEEIEILRRQGVELDTRHQESQSQFDRRSADLAAVAATQLERINVLVSKLAAADVKVAAQSAEIEGLRQQGVVHAQQRQESQARFDRERANQAEEISKQLALVDALTGKLSEAERQAVVHAADLEAARQQGLKQDQHREASQAQFERERTDLAAAAATHLARIDVLVGKLTAADVKVAAQLAEIETLRKRGVDLEQQRQDTHAKVEGERVELTRTVARQQARIDTLAAASSEAQLQATAQAGELDALRKKGDAQDKRQHELEQLLQDRQARIGAYVEKFSALERASEAAAKREQLLRNELLQAEAQIELIKDVVLRESEL